LFGRDSNHPHHHLLSLVRLQLHLVQSFSEKPGLTTFFILAFPPYSCSSKLIFVWVLPVYKSRCTVRWLIVILQPSFSLSLCSPLQPTHPHRVFNSAISARVLAQTLCACSLFFRFYLSLSHLLSTRYSRETLASLVNSSNYFFLPPPILLLVQRSSTSPLRLRLPRVDGTSILIGLCLVRASAFLSFPPFSLPRFSQPSVPLRPLGLLLMDALSCIFLISLFPISFFFSSIPVLFANLPCG